MTVVALHPERARTIGGSDAAAAAGIDPYRSRVMLWAEKTGRVARPETEAMRWGKLIEPVIFDALREDGYDVTPWLGPITDADRPWCTGTPDGCVHLGEREELLEVKTTNGWAHRANGSECPVQYAAQVQHYLHLTGLDRALLAVLVGGQKLELREIRRDDHAIGLLLEAEERFHWHLLTDTPPPPDGSDSAREALAAMFPAATAGATVRFGRDEMALVEQLRARKKQAKALDVQVTALENALKAAMGDAETALSPGDAEVVRWPSVTSHRLDTTRLRAEQPATADLYSTTTTIRRFQVV